MEVPSTTTGTLTEIRVPAGEVAPVGAVVAVISAGECCRGACRQAARRAMPARCHKRARPGSASGTRAAAPRAGSISRWPIKLDPFFEVRTPARNFGPARNAGRHIGHAAGAPARGRRRHRSCPRSRGSGPHGRIVARDVEAARASAARPAAPSWRPGRAPRRSRRSIGRARSRRCRSTACARPSPARLVEAKQTIPHFYLTADVTMDALLEDPRGGQRRRAKKPRTAVPPTSSRSTISSSRRWRSRCSACRRPTRSGPATASCASSIPTSASRLRSTAGCSTPVIRNAEVKIAVRHLQRDEGPCGARPRRRSSSPPNTRAASSAISNLGMYGVREFSAIINPPHATILAVGACAAPAGRERGRRVAFRQPDVGDALLRSPRGRRRARRAIAGGVQALRRQPVTMLV